MLLDWEKARNIIILLAHRLFFPNLGTAAEFSLSWIVRWHLARGVDVNDLGPGIMTPLMLAAGNGQTEVAGLLIERGAAVNFEAAIGGTALHFAAKGGHLDCVKLLLAHGADLGIADNYFGTPLGAATMNRSSNCIAVMDYLLRSGASIDAADSENQQTALIRAASGGNLDAVKFLVQRGADLTLTDVDGYTALHRAIENTKIDVVRFLVDAGCAVNDKGGHGLTALGIAKRRLTAVLDTSDKRTPSRATKMFEQERQRMPEIISLLEQHGAEL